MAPLAEWIVDFVRVRQLNIAIAALLTLFYLAYQYRALLFKFIDNDDDSEELEVTSMSRSRSRTRSRSRGRSGSYQEYKVGDKYNRRARKSRRCPDCNRNLEE